MKEKVSYPYKTKGKAVIFYILILAFLQSRQEDKRF
jgi:hypothetical protein